MKVTSSLYYCVVVGLISLVLSCIRTTLMGEKCCVPGCKSNYELKIGVTVGADERVPIFSFLKDSQQ